MEGLKERILRFISHLGIDKASFEKKVGISNDAVSKMGDNTRKSTLDKISNAYPFLNISWVLTGEGEMLKNNDSKTVQANIAGNNKHVNVGLGINYTDTTLQSSETTDAKDEKIRQLEIKIIELEATIKAKDELIKMLIDTNKT